MKKHLELISARWTRGDEPAWRLSRKKKKSMISWKSWFFILIYSIFAISKPKKYEKPIVFWHFNIEIAKNQWFLMVFRSWNSKYAVNYNEKSTFSWNPRFFFFGKVSRLDHHLWPSEPIWAPGPQNHEICVPGPQKHENRCQIKIFI